ncbi:hypothetical protein [Sphingomonas arenae]|uniref:hypothetical protein n=1 Tax=Sphingomonas arenae TaxID=2812555 RepID=UPI0019678498|nr:hypothetical protein [Sphingomonas arenae]
MAEVTLTASQPALAAIKLAWWRESLQKLDEAPPPPEPRLQAVARELLPRRITGARLARLEDGWAALLEEVQDWHRVVDRGAFLFGIGADLLGSKEEMAAAGRAWAGVDLARRTGERHWLGEPESFGRFDRRARPLTALTALALRDQRRGWPPEPEATPQRSWTILRHRWSGKL